VGEKGVMAALEPLLKLVEEEEWGVSSGSLASHTRNLDHRKAC
jgi:hypothetical protein